MSFLFNATPTPKAKDEKDQKLSIAPLAVHRALASKKGTTKVKLVGRYDIVGTAATALNTVQALSPIGVSDFSGFAALYDLCRVESIDVKFCCLASATIPGFTQYAVALDPSNLGTYSSVADLLTAQTKKGPFLIGGSGLNREPGLSMTKTGFHEMKIKLVETRLTNDSTASNLVGGGWFGTSNSTAVCAWFKPYAESFGAGVVATITMYVEYHCTFKSRT